MGHAESKHHHQHAGGDATAVQQTPTAGGSSRRARRRSCRRDAIAQNASANVRQPLASAGNARSAGPSALPTGTQPPPNASNTRVMKSDELLEMLEGMGFSRHVVEATISQMQVRGKKTVVSASALVEQLILNTRRGSLQRRLSLPTEPSPRMAPAVFRSPSTTDLNASVPKVSPDIFPPQPEPLSSTIREDVEDLPEVSMPTCKICFEKPINTVIIPCGHLCSCSSCVPSIKSNLCPICRQNIKEIIRIYHS